MSRVLLVLLRWLEWAAAVILGILALLSVATFLFTLGHQAQVHELTRAPGILELLDELLVFFVVIELLKMTLAYLQGQNIVPAVLETVLVALARKAVMMETSAAAFPATALALSALLLATAVAWFLLSRVTVPPASDRTSRAPPAAPG